MTGPLRDGRMRRRVLAPAAVLGVLLLAGCGTAAPASTYTPRITIAPSTTASPSPTTSPTPTPAPTGPATSAAGFVAGMTTAQQAGTVLMTAGTVDELPSLAHLVADGAVGGLMIRGRSDASVATVHGAVHTATAPSTGPAPLLVATDQEGGEVQVLNGPGFGDIPSAVVQGQSSPPVLQSRTEVWGRALARAGVNLDLAPVADTPCPANLHDNPPVADLDRNYADDPASAARSVSAVVRGLGAVHVGTAVKHFPGLGCVSENTDTDAHVVDDSITVDSARLAPFTAGIAAGAPAVMVSSAIYAKIDGTQPALFSSKVIGDLLRSKLHFGGLVMSDDVGGAAAVKAWSPGERATKFVAAGGDLLLDIVPADIPAERAALESKATADPVFAARLRDAATHVMAARLAVGG